MTAREIIGEINCSDLEGFWKIYIINKAGAVQRRRWPFSPVEVCWAECRQENSAESWVKFGFGFCILFPLDTSDVVSKTELLKSLEEMC